jgi:hypothetical protein
LNVGCEPWSECAITPAAARRRPIAISSASTTSSARVCSRIDRPTTRRLKQSITVAS